MSSKLMGLGNAKWFDKLSTDKMSFDDIVAFVKSNEHIQQGGSRHKPILHSELLTEFRNRANSVGLELSKIDVGLSRDGMKVMCVADSAKDKNEEYGLSCGFRNSTNSTQSFSGIFGSSCWICSNNCVHGLIIPSRQRNTTLNYNRFGDKMNILFDKFGENREHIAEQIAYVKSVKLNDSIIGSFVKGLISDGEMGNKHICDIVRDILDDVENPSLNSHSDDSCFRLLNACTKVCTHDITNPIMGSNLSRKCNNLIMGIIKEGFTPLGDDVVDVESEVVA